MRSKRQTKAEKIASKAPKNNEEQENTKKEPDSPSADPKRNAPSTQPAQVTSGEKKVKLDEKQPQKKKGKVAVDGDGDIFEKD